jgi:DNA-binding MarR family transcriptional regulator
MKAFHLPGSPVEKAGITPALAVTLSWIAENNGAGISDIARGCGTTKPTATATIDKLEHRGFVERQKNPLDRRNVNVTLTPQGRTLSRSIDRYCVRNMEQLLGRLSQDERQTLVELLEKAMPEETS